MRSWRMESTVVLCAALLLMWLGPLKATEPRETLLMNFGWKFHKGDLPVNHWGKYAGCGKYGKEPGIGLAYDDSTWRTIDLPHDFTVEAFAPDKDKNRFFPAEVEFWAEGVLLR